MVSKLHALLYSQCIPVEGVESEAQYEAALDMFL
jgi:hypothetical protein